jgi:hypothetical protein
LALRGLERTNRVVLSCRGRPQEWRKSRVDLQARNDNPEMMKAGRERHYTRGMLASGQPNERSYLSMRKLKAQK